MMKKATFYILVCFLLVLVFTGQARSTALGTAKVLPGGANFRVEPNLKCKVIQVLPRGSRVELLSKISETWYRVNHNGRTGYIHWSRLNFSEPMSRPRSYLPQGSIITARQEATVAFAHKKWSEVVSLIHPWAGSNKVEFGDLFMLAYAFQEIKQLDQALATFEAAIGRHQGAIDKGFIEVHRHLGALYTKLEKYQQAVDTYNRLLERTPVLVWAMLGKGQALLAAGKTEEAIKEFSLAINCEPDNPEPFVKLGQAFLKLGDTEKAIRCHKAALQKNPKHEDALISLAETYIKIGELESARSILEAEMNHPEFTRVKRMLTELNQAEKLHEQLARASKDCGTLKEQIALSGIVELDVTLIDRLQPHLYEVKLPSGKHAFLRFNSSKIFPPRDGHLKVLASRQPDARVRPRFNHAVGGPKTVPYFKQVSEKERLAYENLNFRLEERERLVKQLEAEMQTIKQ